jgi:hypothetical protein
MLNAASFRRMAILASLIAVLAVPQASAASPRPGSLSWLDRVLSVLRLDLKAGCKIDPNGRCSTNAAQPPHTKAGCHLDPDGRCYTNTTQPSSTKAGCVLDPDGRCLQ